MNDELIKLKYDFLVQCHFELEKKHQIILVNTKDYVQRIQYGLLLLHGAGVTVLSSFILKVYEIHQNIYYLVSMDSRNYKGTTF